MIEKDFHGTIHIDCLAYTDDIVVFSRDDREQLEKLARVLSKLRSHGLRLKPSKCRLFQKEITYLGHCISQHGVGKDHEKTSNATEWPVPECVKDVRRLIGFTSYFRKYIKNCAIIVSHLTSLLQGYSNKPSKRRKNKIKEVDIRKWTNKCQPAFEKLVEDVTLAFADFEKEFFLEVDACKTGLWAVLYQLDGNHKRRPLAYASRKHPEQNRHRALTS